MTPYTAILVAIALDGDHIPMLERALYLCPPTGIHLAHVEEHPVTGYGDLTGKNHSINELHIRQSVFPKLQAIATPYRIPDNQLHIKFGDPAAEIVDLAIRLKCQLIIVGTHGKHGLGILHGSVTKDVVHHAKMDVLTVFGARP